MTFKPSALKATLTSLVALSALMPVSACDLAQNQLKMDRATNNEVQDYRDTLAPREVSMTEGNDTVGEDGGLELQPYVSDVSETMKAMPLVSISINQSIPLREALFELSKQANYDVELDPRIAGSIIFTARNRPFDVVIDRICEIAGLRYKLDGDTLRIELDTPYSQNYKIDYLGMIRKSKSSLDNTVSLTTGGEGGGPSGGSSFKVESSSDADFWAELDTNLKQILASNASGSYLKTEEDPTISLTASNPVAPPVPPIDESALKEGSATATMPPQAGANVSSPMSIPATSSPSVPPSGAPAATASDPAAAAAATAAPDPSATTPPSSSPVPDAQAVGEKAAPAPTQTVLKVESLPTAASSGGQSANRNAVEFTPTYSINKQAGVVSVYANERLHKKVAEYFDELRRSTSSQVLIEAKVLEVRLTDEYAAGIDWNFLDHLGDFQFSLNVPKPAMSPTTTSLMSVGFVGTDLSSFVTALSRFGTVQALASPRLTVLNNQSAALNVAENKVYFEVDVTSTTTGSPPSTDVTVDSTVHTVPEGVLINVMPSIDLAKNSISLQVRPTVTKITEYVDDPAVAYIAATLGAAGSTISSQIPVVNVQEVDSVVKMGSGQMIVMGGLLQDSSSSSSEALPVLGETPVIGNLFRNQGDKVSKTELVIFLKATILNDAGESVHQTDKDIYRVFGQDRRPGKL